MEPGLPETKEKAPRAKVRAYRAPKLHPAEREHMAAALINYLIRPGLMRACEIILKKLSESEDVALAEDVIRLSRDLITRSFPTATTRNAAEELVKKLGVAPSDGVSESSTEES